MTYRTYAIADNMWRWEVRLHGALIRAGWAYNRDDAENLAITWIEAHKV